jgi:hypothetical protein
VSSQVLHHEPTGRIVEAVLKYAAVSNDLQLYSRKEGIFTATETMMVSFRGACCNFAFVGQ